MSKQLLFYERIMPISPQRHSAWSVVPIFDYHFASTTNSVPVTIPEFVQAAQEYPIVFTMDGEVAVPVAILGMAADKGLFVANDGHWDARYVPAFIRRYPFVFSASDDGQIYTLCLDEACTAIDRNGAQGERLFDDKGVRTPYLGRMLDFVNAYQAEHQRTRAFGKLIASLGILEAHEARVNRPDDTAVLTLTGFQVINRQKLRSLPAEKLAELVSTDALELIYLHLQSFANFERLVKRLSGTTPGPVTDGRAAASG